jgi:hypothetical protein
MATLARADITWEAAKASADLEFPPSGVAAIIWSDPDNQDPLATWLPQLLDAVWSTGAAASGYVEGERDAVRYAIEASGDLVSAREHDAGSWHWFSHRLTRVDVRTTRGGTLSLLESWTPGVVIALSIVDAAPVGTIVRTADGDIVVAMSPQARARSLAIVEKVPQAARRPRRPVTPTGVRALVDSRKGVILACTAIVAVLAAAGGVALWRTRTSDSSRQPATLRPAPDAPSFASSSLLASDPVTGHLLLVGCCDVDSRGGQSLVSTWSWDGATWTHLHPAASPTFQRDSGMAAVDATILLQGGEAGDETWSWVGRDWMRLHLSQQPPSHPGMLVYEAATSRVVLLAPSPQDQGGGAADTWAMAGGTWTKVATSGPPLFLTPAMAYDPDRGQVVLIETDGTTTTTWTFWNNAWTKRLSQTDFSLDPTTQLAWDGVYHRIVALHLGDAAVAARNSTTPADTWVWDGSAWTSVPTSVAPNENGRLLTAGSGRAVFVGDHVINGSPDVFEWAGTTWRVRTGNVTDLFSRPSTFDINPTLLDDAGLTVIAIPLRGTPNPTQAMAAAYGALPVPRGLGEHLRPRTTEIGSVIDIANPRNPVVCECWVEDVVLTQLPPCPSVETVERETLVLVDIASLHVVKTFSRTPPAGTAFGSC